jgi:hypothetical protein
MPYEWKDRSGTNIRYKDINEFPANAKKFVNQLSSLGVDNITNIDYNLHFSSSFFHFSNTLRNG